MPSFVGFLATCRTIWNGTMWTTTPMAAKGRAIATFSADHARASRSRLLE